MSLPPPSVIKTIGDAIQASTLPSSAIDEVRCWLEHEKGCLVNVARGVAASNRRRAQMERDALDSAVLTVAGVLPLDCRGAPKIIQQRIDARIRAGEMSSTLGSSSTFTSAMRESLKRIRTGQVSPPVLAVHLQAAQAVCPLVYSSVSSTHLTT